MLTRRTAYLAALLTLAAGPALAETQLSAARLGVSLERTRLVLESDTPFDYRLFPLEHPSRLVLDLQDTQLDAVLRALPGKIGADHPYLKAIRVGRPFGEVARVVLDLKAGIDPRAFTMSPDSGHGHRLVLDVSPITSGPAPGLPASGTRAAPEQAPAAPALKQLSAARVGRTPGRTRIVVESDIPIDYRLFSLDHPARLVLDLKNVELDAVLRGLPGKIGSDHPYLKAIRVGRPYGRVARVVLDLKAAVEPLTFRLEPEAGHGYRLVLDVSPVSAGPAPALAGPAQPSAPPVVSAVPPSAGSPPVSGPPAGADGEPLLLLLEVRLDWSVLSGAIPAYEVGGQTLLPLGELARLLTLAIQTQPEQGTASGFILGQDRGFSLSLPQARVTVAGKTESFDPALVMAEPDDLYVAAALIERWLPLDLEINRSSLSLQVHPRERLPLQERLERERLGERAGPRSGYQDPGYPRHDSPYRLLGVPFVDQTLGLELRKDEGGTDTAARYTGYLTGDLLGMEAALFLSADSRHPDSDPELRFTLGRHDPGADLLGPLHARSWLAGSLSSPSVPNIARGRVGKGLSLSNRPLSQPTSFDRQTFEGDLPPGWDVELYYNDALVGFQLASPDGRYRFEDQPLLYGRNDFRLVFHGPLGQLRVEQHSYSLDAQMTRPGEFYYSLTEHRDEDGLPRSVARFDLGLSRNIAASAGFVRLPIDGVEQRYTSLGLRGFWGKLIVSGDMIRDQDGGSLAELGLKTRLGGMALDLSHAQLDDFRSEEFTRSGDPVRWRDRLRLSGAIPLQAFRRLPLTLDIRRDQLQSGIENIEVAGRVSAYVRRTSFTKSLSWRSFGELESLTGALRISRRLGSIGLSGDIGYSISPESELSVIALAADKPLGDGYRLNLGLAHGFAAPRTLYTAGLSKSLGRFGLGLSASYSSDDELAVGAQLFIAAGREPRRGEWITDALPMANLGAASARVFLDGNGNGVMDVGEEPISGVGFTVDGGLNQARTDAEGIAYLARLPARRPVDVGLDTSTLADPQWLPQLAGVRMVPRPGHVAQLDFPVLLTSEIDGTVYLIDQQGGERGIGDLKLELLDAEGELVAEASSAWDGFYIVAAVPPGSYRLRVSPDQLQRLELTASGERTVTVSADGAFVSGVDFSVRPAP